MGNNCESKQRLWLLCERMAMHDGVLRLDPHDKDDRLIGSLKVSSGHIEWRGRCQRDSVKMNWNEFDAIIASIQKNKH